MTPWRIHITGTVQGVGFRPTVARLAREAGLAGWVRNDIHGVEIALRCGEQDARDFIARLQYGAPPAAHIEAVALHAAPEVDIDPSGGFSIVASPVDRHATPDAAITPDLALCDACRAELEDPRDRRHGYPFINCTQCGPRYSIVESLPYDRARTTMRGFTLCPDCAREYADAGDRRYHAEPNACPLCGPAVRLLDPEGSVIAGREEAVGRCADAIVEGRIVAVKGIGGYHLLCDATSETAVRTLRRRKHRDEKPFAVMFPSMAALEAAAVIDDRARALLTGPAAPIVLVPKRLGEGPALAPSVSPANPYIGALLPYSALHTELLARVARPVVATSGNLAEEPLCTDEADALHRLGGIADLFLAHNRVIARPVDDSVVRLAGTVPMLLLRRARGLAPTPLPLPPGTHSTEPLLCVGGHMKSTVAMTAGARLLLSPHIGDLANPAAVEAFERTIDLLGTLYGGCLTRVVCDTHPDYASTQYARRLGLPVVAVQHHLAHILACLLEHEGGPDRVLGVAWDGTGYGSDGTIWGGEFIEVDRAAGTARRIAHLRPFRLAGGEAAVREPRRCALGLLHDMLGGEQPRFRAEARAYGFTDESTALLSRLLARGGHAPLTTSAGRLFDGVAALLGLSTQAGFEGQAAMQVEFAAAPFADRAAALPFFLERTAAGALQIDWRPMIEAILARRGHEPPGVLAAGFHAALAAATVAVAQSRGIGTVALTGGCFQNALLVDACTRALRDAGFTVLHHRALPPNDGGLSAGQALAALWGITEVRTA